MNLSNLKQHALAIGVFLVLTLAFCYPIFSGKVLQSHDNLSWQYMSHEAKTWYEAHGGPIYWSNSMFSGMPTYTTHAGSGYGNYIATVLFSTAAYFPRPLFMIFIGFLCFYILACSLKLKPTIKIIGSLSYALSSFIAVSANAGHDTKLLSIAFAITSLAGVIYIMNNKFWTGIAILTLSISLMISSGHLQIIYYVLLMLGLIALVLFIQSILKKNVVDFAKKAAIIGLCCGIGFLPTLSTNLLVKEYSKSTIRGGQSELTMRGKEKKAEGGLDKDYAFSWSNGIGETFCLLIPRLYGGASGESYQGGEAYETVKNMAGEEQAENFASQLPLYWGPQPFLSGPIYFGAIIIFLFVLGLFVIKSPHKWWIVASTLFFILLSLGKNFSSLNYFLFDHLPMFNKFRTPSMALSIPMFLMPLLGVWALNEIFNGSIDKKKLMNDVKISAMITGGLALLIGVGASFFFSFKGAGDADLLKQLGGAQAQPLLDAIIKDRASAAMHDGFRSLILILIGAGAIWAYLTNKLSGKIATYIIGVACLFDLFMIGQNYLGSKQYIESDVAEQNYAPRPVDAQILQDKDPYYRVQDFSVNTYNDAKPSYFHKMVGGYHPAKIELYQDLIEMQMSPGTSHNNKEVYNMLNTKYFIVPAGKDGGAQVIPNPEACGNAWFIDSIKLVANADLEMLALNAPNLFDTTQVIGNFKPKDVAIVRESLKQNIKATNFVKDSAASIKLTEYGLNHLAFESTNSNEGFGVFSDVFYDGGWVATIDGKETPIIKTDYVLRGLVIPAGKHKIEFSMMPTSLKSTKTISLVGCFLVLLVFGFGLYKSKGEGEVESI